MATDLRVVLPNRPGALMEALECLGEAGVNIESFCGDIRPGDMWGFCHFLVEDAAKACGALERCGLDITGQHDVVLVDVPNTPGALAAVVGEYARQGRSIEILYTAPDNRVIIGTEDMQRERQGVRMKDARY